MREPGFYWVKIGINQDFEIGYFRNGKWLLSGLSYEYIDEVFDAIDERRIVREEQNKTEVPTARDKEIERRCNAIIKLLRNS